MQNNHNLPSFSGYKTVSFYIKISKIEGAPCQNIDVENINLRQFYFPAAGDTQHCKITLVFMPYLASHLFFISFHYYLKKKL